MKIPRSYLLAAMICAVLYGMVVGVLLVELFTDEEQTKTLLRWALMPTIWFIEKLWPDPPGWVSLGTVMGINASLVFWAFYAAVWGTLKLRAQKEPNQPPEPMPLTRHGSS